MGLTITASVGSGGVNRKGDIEVIQSLLNLKTQANLVINRKCDTQTIAAIKSFQATFMKVPDGRVDVGATTWQKLISASPLPGPPPKPQPDTVRNESIINAVDSDPTLAQAGIILINQAGILCQIRGGPRTKWVYISAIPLITSSQSQEKELPTFWHRWGGTVLNCGSAGATGVVIYLSGGTANFVVGAFAVNSAALCGMSLGKAIEYDAWQEFEANGGGIYKTWLTIETAMSLADLLNGVKGATGFLKAWKEAGTLAKLEKAVAGQKRTRKQLLKIIQQIEPKFQPNLTGVGYFSRAKLIVRGEEILAVNNFKSLGGQQAKVLVDAVGNALTLAGTPDTWTGIKKTYDVWVVQYEDKPEAE